LAQASDVFTIKEMIDGLMMNRTTKKKKKKKKDEGDANLLSFLGCGNLILTGS
jgi:hypothetical protein